MLGLADVIVTSLADASQISFYQTCFIAMMGRKAMTGTKLCRRIEDPAWRGKNWKITQRRVQGHQKIDSSSTTCVETQRHLNNLEKELVEMEVENFATSCSLELHKKQFGLLLHVVSAISFRGMFVTAKFPTFWSTSCKYNLALMVKLKFRFVCRRKSSTA